MLLAPILGQINPFHALYGNTKIHYSVHKRLPLTPVLGQINPFHALYGNTKIHYSVHKRLPLTPVLGQINPFHALPTNLLKICFNIILPSTSFNSSKWSPSLMFPQHNPEYTIDLSHTCHMPGPSHSSLFHHPDNIW